ncbi:MAG: succinylglutamate desuccinylase/aspartoacylase family protein [Rhodospirillaceae bacterium]|nr:MAG: succinylglutamate desuccinylase/aspartoacylase family protein [Rhodospirillaceae bacterium]
MNKVVERVALGGFSAGTQRHLTVHRYGQRGARPKAYIQASLHADEIPGMMAAHHLLGLLDKAAAEGKVVGEIVVVPAANPIGLAQVVNGYHLGRYDLVGDGNFNRHWPDLFGDLPALVEGKLTQDETANIATIRAAIGQRLDGMTALSETQKLKLGLTRLAYDADIVLDVHCDDDSLMHVYIPPEHWPAYSDLAAELEARACLTSADSGSFCFDETFYMPWSKLRQAVGDKFPIPSPCFVATVELRGQADVSDELGAQDAAALFRFLQRHGAIAGNPGEAPALLCEATPLDATDVVQTPAAGILAYKVALGDKVKAGDHIADVIDPMADAASARTRIVAVNDGFVLAKRLHKLVIAGHRIAKIVGTQSLKHRQAKLMLE